MFMTRNPSNSSERITAGSRGPSGQAGTPPLVLALDAQDLADALGISKGTVEKLRDQGVLTCVKFTGRCIRYPVHQAIAAMDRLAGIDQEEPPSPA